ncbi:MAG: hypothetical protein FWD19_06370, partial [Defluviitaleaceae bacterium]|nr:hypothetical protein [Defluviitaleaceae bacterium]
MKRIYKNYLAVILAFVMVFASAPDFTSAYLEIPQFSNNQGDNNNQGETAARPPREDHDDCCDDCKNNRWCDSTATPAGNYSHLSMTPGRVNSEMRFTWYSASATGSVQYRVQGANTWIMRESTSRP